ncbi:Siroheme synthase [Pseudooceanicola batsensis HTCC2597]|uniref:precorrin-2 dehydrogenase n=1 Tax=Pseudooceanicola batsensis (strain ATCC BAA-863 / DSM 15984 / KCTC 12145 / HTCC2597) TaxID=252305 RepID=A3U1T7_PSEBH|nr:NAD(P)-dependent oxidoreductase [Pseudooceanicola batsensis]EAQ01871.1 Siroheme synthase [Pseudooceanicola batsensis HTCC2597]
MQHFPIFLAMAEARVLLSGGGAAALAKLRLLMKTPARIEVFSRDPAPEIDTWARQGRLRLARRDLQRGDLNGASLVYAADEDDAMDARTLAFARAAGVLTNVVDNLGASDFITPAMVDRAPVTVAIGTEGAAPVLARRIKARLEEDLPVSTGPLAAAAAAFRDEAEALPHGAPRREFWADWFDRAGPEAHAAGRDLRSALAALLGAHRDGNARPDRVTLAWTGSDDPDLLVMKTRRALDTADVVVHDDDIAPGILELARREADFITLHETATVPPLPQLLARRAKGGRHVLYLSSRPGAARLETAVRAAGAEVTVIPGIAAGAATERREQA